MRIMYVCENYFILILEIDQSLDVDLSLSNKQIIRYLHRLQRSSDLRHCYLRTLGRVFLGPIVSRSSHQRERQRVDGVELSCRVRLLFGLGLVLKKLKFDMAARRLASSTVDWAEFARKIPDVQRASFLALKGKQVRLLSQVLPNRRIEMK